MKTLAIFAAAAALAVSARGEQITAEPDAFLDYIEATGSQYINTGVNAETGLKAYVDFAWADFSGNPDWSLLDACIDSSVSDKRNRFLMCHMFNGKPFFAYGLKQRKNPAFSVPFVGGQRCTIVTDMSSTNSLELIQDGVKTFDDGDREYFATNGNDVNLNLNLFVFATNLSGRPDWYGRGKLYEMKIFKKNATTGEFDLLRHYIPCIKDNRAGLYDKVNGTISFSLGSADFIAGSVTNTVTTSYVDADGTLHENVKAIPLDNTMTELDAGWYVVNSNVTVNSRIDLTGNTNLILADGYTLDVKGIYIPQGSTLTIYAQSDGENAGKIVSKPTSGAGIGGMTENDNGNIVICGGIIEATGGENSAAIGGGNGGSGGTITIYGGNINASGSYGIGAGKDGADVAITLGWMKATDQIYASSYSGTVTIADGKSFYNGSEVINSGDVTDMRKLNDKTLQPCVLLTVGADNDYSDRTSELGSWAGTDMTVAFQRAFTDGAASTVCLPFPMTSIAGGNVYGFRGITWDATLNNEGGWVATMIDQSPEAGNLLSATEANKPYLFMPNATGDVTFTGTIASVPAEITAGSTTSTDWTFNGTYSRLTYSDDLNGQHIFGFAASTTAEDKEKGQDAVTAGEFVKAISGAYIPAFRAFLKYSGSDTYLQARGTRGGAGIPETITVRLIGKSGEIDGIGEIRLSTGEVTFDPNAWYDLNGRRLDGKPTQKGIYINGGKKVAIK